MKWEPFWPSQIQVSTTLKNLLPWQGGSVTRPGGSVSRSFPWPTALRRKEKGLSLLTFHGWVLLSAVLIHSVWLYANTSLLTLPSALIHPKDMRWEVRQNSLFSRSWSFLWAHLCSPQALIVVLTNSVPSDLKYLKRSGCLAWCLRPSWAASILHWNTWVPFLLPALDSSFLPRQWSWLKWLDFCHPYGRHRLVPCSWFWP